MSCCIASQRSSAVFLAVVRRLARTCIHVHMYALHVMYVMYVIYVMYVYMFMCMVYVRVCVR